MKAAKLTIAGKTAVYHKLVFEVRYEHGLIYLDRCGATANRIMKTDPNWILKGDSPSPQNAPLINVLTGTSFNFSALKYDFSMDQSINKDAAINQDDINSFISQAELVSAIVHEELELRSFIREGFRVWYIFGTESAEDSQQWIANLGAFQVAPNLLDAFNATLETEGHVVVLNSTERKYRISINAVERLEQLDLGSDLKVLPRDLPKRQKEALLNQLKAKNRLLTNPSSAVMIDVDAYVERPIDIAAGDFIRHSLSAIELSMRTVFPGAKK